MKPNTLLMIVLTGLVIVLSAPQAMAERTQLRRNVTFIVRKPDRVKNIAVRFHVQPKTLVMLNKPIHKRQMVYAGKKLVIPVWFKKRNNLVKESSDFNLADYELLTDSLDEYVKEDFISMADIEADTVRLAAIEREVRVIDKKINVLNMRMDSIQMAQTDGSFDVSKKELQRMKIARATHAGNFAVGAEIDTLKQQKAKLYEEKTRINARVEDYENLVENADYNAMHHDDENEPSGKFTLREWGDDPSKAQPAVSAGHKK